MPTILQVHANDEEALDDLVVQITDDAFPISQDGLFTGVSSLGG